MRSVARRERGATQIGDGRDTDFDLLLEPNADNGYHAPAIEQLVDEAFSLLTATLRLILSPARPIIC